MVHSSQLINGILPINILCSDVINSYLKIPYCFPWDINMNVRNFNNHYPVITHSPCAQWSRLKHFAKVNLDEKELSYLCYKFVQSNGGIFEHPAGSSFFKYINQPNKVISINQHWFGFPTEKRTYLYFNNCSPAPFPLCFDAIEKRFDNLTAFQRSHTTLTSASWLTSSIRDSFATS
jgi:hypothetical protein